MPLLHFLDTGLAAYLLKWGNPEALERGAMSGAFFESYVFSEIYKSYLNEGKEPPVLEPVKTADTFEGLESLKTEIGTGSVICMADDLLPVDEKNWYVPVWLI